MRIGDLVPVPTKREGFRRSRLRFVPGDCGCYVLATFDGHVLYVGLTKNLRRRMGQHLDNQEKVKATDFGRAVWFLWLECDNLSKVERTWMNIHVQHHGKLPILNKIYSATSS
ncbi:GIY-YIG nuclease family protein [Sinorhizobium fredii]|uniref:GIY-YIG nuclease family protein n=1 Tax=Rhizobium fredii TaxID=380 RepID=UPI0005955CE1|nr:GIY-YIG nuclease family protein [Sinorhizobium fredii]WOS65839.1 GIY-YIG nuclease family protein [Sinorhizobium fredii GR64]